MNIDSTSGSIQNHFLMLSDPIVRRILDFQGVNLEVTQKVCQRWQRLSVDVAVDQFLEKSFSARDWKARLNLDVVETPLPKNIREILVAECPFNKGKRIYQTHMLVYIPERCGEESYCLNLLQRAIKPLALQPGERRGTPGRVQMQCTSDVIDVHGEASSQGAHWALMTKEVLPGSEQLSLSQSSKLLKGDQHYSRPYVLEAVTTMLLWHLKTGEMVFGSTYTSCAKGEKRKIVARTLGGFVPYPVLRRMALCVGGFTWSDLNVTYKAEDGPTQIKAGTAAIRHLKTD